MYATTPESAAASLFPSVCNAVVTSVQDDQNMGRVEIRLLSCDGLPDQDAPIWARVAVPFAGSNRGAFLIPDVGDEVLVTFLYGDSRLPIIIGGLWNGAAKTKEKVAGDRMDRWAITGRQGTRIAIVEESKGTAAISFTTPGGVSGTLTDTGGGKVELQTKGMTLTMDPSGISLNSTMQVKVKASTSIEVTAPQVTVNAMLTEFKGFIRCAGVQGDSVIGASYTPGVGQIW